MGKRDFWDCLPPALCQGRHVGEAGLELRLFSENFLWFPFTGDYILIFMVWGLVTHRSFCVVGNKTKPPLLNGLPSSQFRDQEGVSQVHSCLVWFKLFVNAARFSLKTDFVVLHPHKELAFLMFGAITLSGSFYVLQKNICKTGSSGSDLCRSNLLVHGVNHTCKLHNSEA